MLSELCSITGKPCIIARALRIDNDFNVPKSVNIIIFLNQQLVFDESVSLQALSITSEGQPHLNLKLSDIC